MTYNAFLNGLKNNADTHLFLLYGENDYLKQESLKAIFKHFDFTAQDLDIDRFDGKTNEDDIILACQTLSFMSEKRLVVAEDFAPLKQSKQNGDKMLAFLETLSDRTVLIFYMNDKVDKRKKIYKAIVQQGMTVEFGETKEQDLAAWVVYAFANQGKKASSQVAHALIERSGRAMYTLKGEVDKLASYVNADEVKVADVIKIASKTLEYNVYLVHDLLIKKKVKEALLLLDEIIDTEKSPFGLMGLIANKFRLMYKGRTLIAARYPQDKAIKLMGGHPYAAKMAFNDAKQFSVAELREGLNTLAKLDYQLKTGQSEGTLSFNKTLLEIYRI